MRQQYLATLGLNLDADQPAIKAAFRRLASLYHPDKSPNQRVRFIEICHAYDQLTANNIRLAKPVMPEKTEKRRLGKRGEPTQRRFEALLEKQYKGVFVSIKA